MYRFLIIIFVILSFSLDAQDKLNLEGKVYECGSVKYFDSYNKCDFYFECDCCFGDYIFLSNQKFIFVFYCSSDYVITGGNYLIIGDSVILKSTNQRLEINYNYEREVNKAVPKYILNDTITDPYKIVFKIDECENTILVRVDSQNNWMAKETSQSDEKLFSKFKALGIHRYLKRYGFLNHDF